MSRPCKCGCGTPTTIKQGRVYNDYIYGHQCRKPAPTFEDIKTRCELDPVTGCWNWTGANSQGYGVVKTGQKQYKVTRYVLSLLDPTFDESLVVRHKCDNPRCCNPDHLEPGTQRDNAADMVERLRSNRGARHHNVRLTEEDVIEILTSTESQADLMRKYKVGRQHMSDIVNGKRWRHVYACLLSILFMRIAVSADFNFSK